MGTTLACGHDRIKQQIEAIRVHMMELGARYGLNDPKVLDVSRELDALIVSYHKSKRNK